MLVAHRTKRRNRNALDPSNIPAGTPAAVTSSVPSNKWRMVFTNPVMVKALPTDFTVNGAAPTAYTQDSPTQVTLTFAVNVAAGQVWVVPANSPHIRTPSGGYVAAATGTF